MTVPLVRTKYLPVCVCQHLSSLPAAVLCPLFILPLDHGAARLYTPSCAVRHKKPMPYPLLDKFQLGTRDQRVIGLAQGVPHLWPSGRARYRVLLVEGGIRTVFSKVRPPCGWPMSDLLILVGENCPTPSLALESQRGTASGRETEPGSISFSLSTCLGG